jgi:hypothetical protein
MQETGKVMQNHENVNVRNTGKREAQHQKHRRLKVGGGQWLSCRKNNKN